MPHVVEPAAGVDRAMLAFMVDAYDEEEVEGRQRTLLRLHPRLAPVKVAVLPLVNKDGSREGAEIYEELRDLIPAEYDTGGSIGKRYRRQDEIGTPWGVTVDHQTMEDDTVTLRDRDTLEQTDPGRRASRRAQPPPGRALDLPEAQSRSLIGCGCGSSDVQDPINREDDPQATSRVPQDGSPAGGPDRWALGGPPGRQPGQRRDRYPHRTDGHEHAPIGPRPQRRHQQGGTGDQRNRDWDERGAPAGERGFGRWRSPEQVGDADQSRHDPGGDPERGLADVERLEQRASRRRGRAHGEPADRSAEGGHPHNGPVRPPGVRDSGRGPGRVERQNHRDHPQPGR